MKKLVMVSCIALSACTQNSTVYKNVDAKPTLTSTSMDGKLKCASILLKNTYSDTAYVVLVREVVDGTIRKNSSLDGPLADAGADQLKGRLNSLIPPENGLIIDQYPPMFRSYFSRNKNDKFGTPNVNDLQTFKQKILKVVNGRRASKGINAATNLALISVDGSFSRLDGSSFANSGTGINGGFDADKNRDSGDFEYGKSNSSKVVSLLVNLIRPDMNILVKSHSMDLIYKSNTGRYNLKSQFGDVRFGWSFSKSKIESLLSAQQTLIDSAALWVVSELYKNSKVKNLCLK